jgi:DNA-binding IclR family transcriptional regulator
MTTKLNRSVYRTFALLKAFKSSDEWVTVAELSRRAGLAEASAHRFINTLVEIGAIVRGPHARIRPGMVLVSLSQHVVVSEVLKEAACTILADLASQLDATMNLACLQSGMVTYIAKIGTPTSISTYPVPNGQFEPYYSALGKVLLASLSADEVDAIISDGALVPLTPFTITDRNVLRTTIEDVRRFGFAIDNRESRHDICCVAVPVYDPDGQAIAAMSAADYAQRMGYARQSVIRSALGEAAVTLTQRVFPDRATKWHQPQLAHFHSAAAPTSLAR